MRIEKKFYSYEEICEKFLDFTNVSSFDYQNIVYSMVEYARQKNGLEDVVVTFNYDSPKKFEAVAMGPNAIKFSKEMLKKNITNPRELLDTYICIEHEFSHILDMRQNNTLERQNQRSFISFKTKAIMELAKAKPEKEEAYKNLEYGMYFIDRSETFARRRALEESKRLVRDLYELAKTKFKTTEYYVNLTQKYNEAEFENLKNNDKETYDNVMKNKFANNFVRYRNHLENCEQEDFEYFSYIKDIEIDDVKNDFIELASQVLDPNKIDLQMENIDKQKLSQILQIPEFYDDTLAHRFYDYFEKTQDFDSCKLLTQIEQFNIAQKQIKILNKNIKNNNINKNENNLIF